MPIATHIYHHGAHLEHFRGTTASRWPFAAWAHSVIRPRSAGHAHIAPRSTRIISRCTRAAWRCGCTRLQVSNSGVAQHFSIARPTLTLLLEAYERPGRKPHLPAGSRGGGNCPKISCRLRADIRHDMILTRTHDLQNMAEASHPLPVPTHRGQASSRRFGHVF